MKSYKRKIKPILIERIRDMKNCATYDRILEKRKVEIENLKTKIQDILNMEQTVKRRKKEIIVLEMEKNELVLVIVMNVPFGEYGEIFVDDGNVTLAHNGDYKPIRVG